MVYDAYHQTAASLPPFTQLPTRFSTETSFRCWILGNCEDMKRGPG